MSESPVNLHADGPPRTELERDPAASSALTEALGRPAPERRGAVAAVVSRWPRDPEAWACLAELGRDTVERYAAYRVGYHRGLDDLRAAGWSGSGYVRWSHEGNRGFLRCLAGLAEQAREIGEFDEAERCGVFLNQLDPEKFPPVDDRGSGA